MIAVMKRTSKAKTDHKALIQKKYKEILSNFKGKTVDEQLVELLTDLINHSEGIWDYFGIRYDTIMTPKEWKAFSTHPERIPYKTKIKQLKGKEFHKIFDFILDLLKDVYPYFVSLPKGEYKETLRKSILSVIECSLNARYEIDEMREADQYIGRTDFDRDNAHIEMTETSMNRYIRAINEYALDTGKDPKKIMERILEATDNNLLKLTELLYSCDLDDELRKDLDEILLILKRDLTLSFSDIKRGWDIWKKMKNIGIDVDGYLELLGLPDYNTVKRRLLDFMKNEDHIEEMLNHMKDELPTSYKKFKKNGSIEITDLNAEDARRKKYPKKLRSDDEIENMVEKVKSEIYSFFPLAKVPSPRTNLFNPTHPAATPRAFNSTIKNTHGRPVNTIVMTPRVDHIDDYLPTFAHETTHALHKKILDLGEQAGVLKKGASDMVTISVAEDFSQLVDDEFTSDKDLPYKKKYKGKEFPNFRAGRGTRFQVPFALIQLTMRKEFEKFLDSGFDGILTEKMLWELKYKMDKYANTWFSTGLNITAKGLTASRLFTSYDPRDGIAYMKRYMMQENKKVKSTKESEQIPKKTMKMTDAFRKRWGKEWIKEPDARIMLHWLMLESGRNEKTEEYFKFIQQKPIEECLDELKKIGLKRSDLV